MPDRFSRRKGHAECEAEIVVCRAALARWRFVVIELTLAVAVLSALTACTREAAPAVTASVTPTPRTREQTFVMQERCGRDAREWFRQFYGDGDKRDANGEMHAEYRNRYDTGNNRCLALASGTTYSKPAGSGGPTVSQWAGLVDVNENHNIGTCMELVSPNKMTVCEIEGNKYSSLADWEAAAKLYMGD
jgi:hypothetical protein